MDNYNRSNRYRNDNRSSSKEKNFDMNWDRNYDPDYDHQKFRAGDKNIYSSDRENEYWDARDRMNRMYSNRNEHEYGNRNYENYYNYDRDINPGSRNQRYNETNSEYYPEDRYRYDNFREMSDNYRSRPERYYRNNNYNSNNWRNTDRDWWDKTKDEVASWFGDDDAERRRRRDEIREGQHRGKGPKNYTRSEERIREDVSDQLSDDSFLDASGIEVSVKEGDVTLNGVVDSRYSKHRAEDLAEDVTGVKHVQNNLRVVENIENTINKSSVNNGNRPITTNTNYATTKNKNESVHG